MRISRFIFSALLLLTCASLSYAQSKSIVELALTKKLLRGGEVSLLARQSNLALQERLGALFRQPLVANPPIYYQLPPSVKPLVFRVQQDLQAPFFATASAFAVEIDGHLFGVTAGHVMSNISQNPYMYLQTPEGHVVTEKITSWRMSNPMGTDVAVFEIPPQAQAYLQPIPLSAQRAQPLQMSSIAGFSLNEPLWLAKEEILLTSSHRLLIRNNFRKDNTGMCGSPVMVNGKAAGVYIGAFSQGVPKNVLWLELLKNFNFKSLPPSLHMAAPIENILPLAHDLLGKNVQDEGILMKALGHPIAVLHPQDELYSVMLLRDGQIKQIIRAKELTDPEHLEQFLELEENDVLRVTIFPKHAVDNHSILRYEINVSSGKVTQPEDNF